MSMLCMDLSDRLTSWGVHDLEAILWPLGVRTWVCFSNLTDDEFSEVCQLVRQAGAGPGHVCILRLMREEAHARMPSQVKTAPSTAFTSVDGRIEQLRAAVAEAVRMISEASKDGILAEAQALLIQISTSPESASNSIAARALDLVNTVAKTGTKHKQLQRIMQDVLVLCCCRNVDHSDVEALKSSFGAAFGRDIQSEGLVSKLLNARWQLFERSARPTEAQKRRPKNKKQPWPQACMSQDECHQPWPQVQKVHVAQEPPRVPTPDFGRDELSDCRPEFPWQRIPIKENKTFVELDIVSNKSRARSLAAASSPAGWPLMAAQIPVSSPQIVNTAVVKLPLKDIWNEIGSNRDAVTAFLSESFESLRSALSWTFSDSECSHSSGDAAQMSRDRTLLMDIAQSQMVSSQVHENVFLAAEAWLQASEREHVEKRHRMTQQLIFLGLLLGIKDILPMLFRALDAGLQSGDFDEDLIACTFRAIIELKALGLLVESDAADVLNRITHRGFKPKTQYCISAYIGVLGTLCTPFVESLLWEKIFGDIVSYGVNYLPKYNTDSLVYEAVWALNRIFKVAGSLVLSEWAEKCLDFAGKVKNDPYLSSCRDGWEDHCPDAIHALNEAEKLELYLRCKSNGPAVAG